MKTVKFGIIGTGLRCRRGHLPAFAALKEDVIKRGEGIIPELAAICDKNENTLKQFEVFAQEKGYSPKTYLDADEFITGENDLDGIIIATTNDALKDIAIKALVKNKLVLCEKPAALKMAHFDEMQEAENNSRGALLMAFNLRSHPVYSRIKEHIEKNEIGKVKMISCIEVRGPFIPEWAYYNEMSGGTLLTKNCHDFDIFNWYVKSDPVRVHAFGGRDVVKKGDAIDNAVVNILYKNGVKASFELCMFCGYGEHSRVYDLRGDQGLIRMAEDPGAEYTLFKKGTREKHNIINTFEGGHGGADYEQAKKFTESMLSRQRGAFASLAEGKRSAAIAIAAQLSIDTGKVIEIDENLNVG